jgi:hypothetical protein
MNEEEKLLLKQRLFNACRELVQEKIKNLEISMNAARESGNDETKSTTGDKHETGKAMMQLEQEKIGIQLNEMQKMSKVLEGIPRELSLTKIKPGNLVITEKGNFYISVAAGKIKIDDKIYFAISAVSPLGNLFLNAATGKTVKQSENYYTILDSF